MKIIIAPDSFKECLPARAVAAAMAEAAKEVVASMASGREAATTGAAREITTALSDDHGDSIQAKACQQPAGTTVAGQIACTIEADRHHVVSSRKADSVADVVELPLADGGECTVDILTAALGGTLRSATVSDALGRPLTATYGVVAPTRSGVATAHFWGPTVPLHPSTGEPSAPVRKAADGFSGVFPTAGAETEAADGFRAVFPTVGAETEAADGFRAVFPTVGAEVGASGAADVSPGKTAGALGIIEVAAACGLERLAAEERNPLVATSRGVGELIMAAYADGCRQFIIGLGGSATCDGGKGMLSVPGIKEVLRQAQFEVLRDVDAPFIGPRGAARVFAPQKGASPEDVEILEKRMQTRAATILRETGCDIAAVPGAGAAGGLGGAFLAYGNATLSPGISRVLDLVGFDADLLGHDPKAVAQCAQDCSDNGAQPNGSQCAQGSNHSGAQDAQNDRITLCGDSTQCAQDGNGGPVIVITGEGRSDLQTLQGKLPLGVLQRVRALTRADEHRATEAVQGATAEAQAPIVLLISGAVAPDARKALQEAGFSAVVETTPAGTPLSDALAPDFARRCIKHAVKTALSNYL